MKEDKIVEMTIGVDENGVEWLLLITESGEVSGRCPWYQMLESLKPLFEIQESMDKLAKKLGCGYDDDLEP